MAIIWVKLQASTTKSELKSEITSIDLKAQQIASNTEGLRSDLSRLNTDNSDNLRKKYDTISVNIQEQQGRVYALDISIKNFYSKWARKLGQIDKKGDSEPGNADTDPLQADIENLTSPAVNSHPRKRTGSFRKNLR